MTGATSRHANATVLRYGACSTTYGFTPGAVAFGRTAFLDVRTYIGARSEVQCESIGLGRSLPPHTKDQKHLPEPAAIVGCARNIASDLKLSAVGIESIGRIFSKYSVLIWEDGSSDSTRATLTHWASHNLRVRVLGPPPAVKWVGDSLGRIAQLAFCRQVLLAESLKLATPHATTHYTPPRYYIAMDLDCPAPAHPQALSLAIHSHMVPLRPTKHLPPVAGELRSRAASVAGSTRFDALFANSQPYYYDQHVLRSSSLTLQYDCIEDKATMAARGTCRDYTITIDPAAPPIAVDSAFNGLAVYSLASLRDSGCRYHGPLLRQAEHAGLHACLRSAGLRLAIAPSLVYGCGQAQMAYAGPGKTAHEIAVLRNGTFVVRRSPLTAPGGNASTHLSWWSVWRYDILELLLPDGTLIRALMVWVVVSKTVLAAVVWRRARQRRASRREY